MTEEPFDRYKQVFDDIFSALVVGCGLIASIIWALSFIC